jgi:hypothetical protein
MSQVLEDVQRKNEEKADKDYSNAMEKKEKKLIREKRKNFREEMVKTALKKSAVRNHFVSKIEILRKIL